jgi:hypothetical protein
MGKTKYRNLMISVLFPIIFLSFFKILDILAGYQIFYIFQSNSDISVSEYPSFIY